MPVPEPLNVVVVDDSVVIRSFLRKAFDAAADMQVVGAAADGEKGVAMVKRLKPDLVVLDVEMPVMDGLTALEHIRVEFPNLPAIFFTSTNKRQADLGMRVLAIATTVVLLLSLPVLVSLTSGHPSDIAVSIASWFGVN